MLLAISSVSVYSQKYEYYSRQTTDNGEMTQLEAPVHLSINLLVDSVTINDNGKEVKEKLAPDNIIYSSDSPSSQVVI